MTLRRLETGGTQMAITEHEVLETGTDAFNAHDIGRLAELLADEVAFRAPGGQEGGGKAACIQFYDQWLDEFPNAQLDVHRVHVTDDVAVEEGTFTGTHSGTARTGRSVELDYVQVVRFCEGKQVSLSLTFDRLLMLQQLGLAADTASAS
jgi:ketosteroid isomerase-like protein